MTTFVYWPVQGQGEPLRYLIAYLGLKIDEQEIDLDMAWWGQQKTLMYEQGQLFPNLPHLRFKDGRILSETGAIMAHLAHQANRDDLLGKSNKDKVRINQLRGVLYDIRKAIMMTSFQDGALEKIQGSLPTVEGKLADLSRFLGNNDFLLGYLTNLDFEWAHYSHLMQTLLNSNGLDDVFAKFPNLIALRTRVRNLYGMKDYFATGQNERYPLIPHQFCKLKINNN